MGQRIGGYDVLQHLASGGMGRVYLGRTTGPGNFERYVVLKILDLNVPDTDPQIAMFLDEARVIGSMYHQHIAPAFAVARGENGRYFLVMDYIHGRSTAMVWDRTLDLDAALPLDFVVTVCTAAANALHYAHTRTGRDGRSLGIIHRDVSLSNLMVGFDGAVKLIDFGIAKAADRSTITQVGFVKGKLGYMSPEQVTGAAVDHRADVFALGVVLYELATMTRAFRDETEVGTLERIKKCTFEPPSQVVDHFPPELERIITTALQRDPSARYPDADALARELSAFAHANRLVMGDAAITEVMMQLFDDRKEPWLLEDGAPGHVDDSATVPIDTTVDRVPPRRHTPRPIVKHLRTASEVIELTVLKDRADSTPTSIHPTPVSKTPGPAAMHAAAAAMVHPAMPRQRSPLVWIVPIAILISGGGIAAWLIRDRQMAAASAPPSLDAAIAEPVAKAPAPDAAVDANEQVDAAPTSVKLEIVTTPSDATVLLDGVRLGRTPFSGDLPADDDTHVLKLRKRGYETRVFEIILTGDVTQQFKLVPAD
ncbi:MAG TPA: serine/threonine-protein kinase [Kofleriaceae bacterium]